MNPMTQVLLVDDNSGDTDLVSDALAQCRWPSHVRSVADGEQAMAFLHREGKYANELPPDLVILDLNMPRKNGRAVLAEVKGDPVLHSTPIVIFSPSQAGRDVCGSYDLGANGYVAKPGNLHDFMSAVQSIGDFWLGRACLPRKEEA
jgi:two-component system, chemotaxis family, response regulator Rcp1